MAHYNFRLNERLVVYMDMSNVADIVISYVDVDIINNAIKQRALALGEQMNPEAADQFISDMNEIVCSVKSNGSSLTFSAEPSESYLINYLKSHGTPVAGGDDGTAHNVDGSTYQSRVPERLWGTPLPEFELPVLDGNDEAQHMVELLAPDAARNAVESSKDEIAHQIVIPYIQQQIGG